YPTKSQNDLHKLLPRNRPDRTGLRRFHRKLSVFRRGRADGLYAGCFFVRGGKAYYGFERCYTEGAFQDSPLFKGRSRSSYYPCPRSICGDGTWGSFSLRKKPKTTSL